MLPASLRLRMSPEEMNIDVSQLRTYNYILSVEKRLAIARANFLDFALSITSRFLLAITSTFLVFGSAILIFFVVQYSMLPKMHHTFPVNLRHPDCQKCLLEVCAYPNSTVVFTDGKSSRLPHHGLLMGGQVYSFSVEIDLPESEVNMDSGVFVVEITLRSFDDEVIQSSARAASMRYHSFVHHVMRLFLLWPFYLSSWMEERQQIRLEVLPYYEESPYRPLTNAFITIQRSRVDVYKMELHVDAKLEGFRFYLEKYPLIIGSFMIMTNFFCGMAVVSLVAYSRLKDMEELNVNKRKVNVNFEIEEQETERDEKDETDEDDHEREETEIEDDFLVPDVLVPVSMDPLETTSCESKDF